MLSYVIPVQPPLGSDKACHPTISLNPPFLLRHRELRPRYVMTVRLPMSTRRSDIVPSWLPRPPTTLAARTARPSDISYLGAASCRATRRRSSAIYWPTLIH